MGKTYIPITEANKKNILNFIGMCRMNGLEGMAEPSFSFKDIREDIGTVIFDVFYSCRGITEPSWNMTVKVDSDVRFHDSAASKAGETYCYLDSYRIEKDSLEFKTKTSKFNVFSFQRVFNSLKTMLPETDDSKTNFPEADTPETDARDETRDPIFVTLVAAV